MCIAIFKPAKANMPSLETLDNCFENNPDGFGLAYVDKSKECVQIVKGGMSTDEMHQIITGLSNRLKKATVLLHFRRATDGKVCPQNCHPYPLSSKIEFLKATKLSCSVVLAHNGIIREGGITYGGTQAKDTDTQLFIKTFLAPLADIVFDRGIPKILASWIHSSKFILLSATKYTMIGVFEQHKGCFYSNKSYEKRVVTTFQPTTQKWNPQTHQFESLEGNLDAYDYELGRYWPQPHPEDKKETEQPSKIPSREPKMPIVITRDASECAICHRLVKVMISNATTNNKRLCFNCYSQIQNDIGLGGI